MQRRLKPYRVMMHVLALAPIPVMAILLLTHRLGFNPIQTLQHRSGDIALILLLLSLTSTPLKWITRMRSMLAFSRPLGLYAFLYALLHVLIFFVLDYGLKLQSAFQVIINNQYLWPGALAFLLLLIMALTSNDRARVLLKKNWKKIHSLTYLASLLVILHFGLSMKGNFFRLRGQILFPLIALVVWLILIILRIYAVRRRRVQP